jgi:uncharacterized 2Fe-2S/4Fe-4S cluster protein (DUF4445 family)
VFYDLQLSVRYARSVLIGEKVTPQTALLQLVRLISLSMKEHGVPASAVKSVGIAASAYVSCRLEELLTPTELYLSPETEIYILPFVSAEIGGGFAASLLTIDKNSFVAAHLGSSAIFAHWNGEKLVCASFALSGAFDCSGLESGMPAERGAIYDVSKEKDGTVCYAVAGDRDSIGISPSAAVQAAEILLRTGSLDSDGILTDRDLFYIGEDFYISQNDVRAIQTDKAKSAAAAELFLREIDGLCGVFLSGEPFCGSGFESMLALGAIPQTMKNAGYCRISSEQGIIRFLESKTERERLSAIVLKTDDITEKLLPEYDELYINKLPF